MEATLSNGERWIISWVRENGPIRAAEVADGLGVSRATALRRLNGLCDKGVLERNGSPRSPTLAYELA